MHITNLFQVITNSYVKELKPPIDSYVQKQNILISQKFAKLEYTTKIGFLISPNIQFANPSWYQHHIAEFVQCHPEDIDIRKETVYQQKVKSKCITISAILSKSTQID